MRSQGRGAVLAGLLLLAACSGRSNEHGLGPGQPGLDVADAALRSGSPQIALQATDAMLARNPTDPAVLLVRADALTALGRFDDALDAYSRVLQANPDSPGAHIGMGRIQLASNPVAAETQFLNALQHDPRNTIALTDLGIARDLQGRHADAQTAYRQALGIAPDQRGAQVNLALSMAMSGQGRQAVDMIRPLAEAPGATRKLRHDYAAVLAMSGNRPEAEHILAADLSPAETRQALDAYAARPATTMLADSVPAETGSPAATRGQGMVQQPVARTSAAQPSAIQRPAVQSSAAQASAAPPPSAAEPRAVQSSSAAELSAVQPGAPSAPAVAVAETAPGIQVQLSAAVSEDAANAEWQRLQEKLPGTMNGHHPLVSRVERDGKVFWRLRTNGFTSQADAHGFCDQVRGAGSGCVVSGG